jgi:methylase of polypeptide subunit release factors
MTPPVSSSPPPAAPSDALAGALRTDLDAARFTVGGVEAVLGSLATAALGREQDVAALRETARALARRSPEPAAVLTQIFLLGRPVSRRLLDAALPALGAAGAERLGLVASAGAGADDEVRALVDLRPYAATDAGGELAWWLASDLSELQTGRRLAADHVLGAGGASLTLAQVTMRTPRDRVLDLGTGCGIQALHAARHAGHVVGTDISARALAFARFNLALAGIDDAGPAGGTVELREGSMLDPVAGEGFDLVVSNPPFVITPRGSGAATGSGVPERSALPDYEYRDGGRSGDDVVRDLVLQVGSVLRPGGVAQLLGNWEHRRGEPWAERVGAWLDEAGLDGWIIQREVQDPAEYAETWIRDGGTTPEREPDVWSAAYGAWLDDFASRDVEAVGFGIVTLRKPDPAGPAGGRVTLRRLEEHTGSVHQPLGAHLAASLAAHDWLVGLGLGADGWPGGADADAALLGEHLVVAADVTEERYLTPGAADPNVVLLRQGDGLGRAVHASTGLAALVGASDGELTVGRLTEAIAGLFDVDAGELASDLLPGVRGLVGDGFLTPLPPTT